MLAAGLSRCCGCSVHRALREGSGDLARRLPANLTAVVAVKLMCICMQMTGEKDKFDSGLLELELELELQLS